MFTQKHSVVIKYVIELSTYLHKITNLHVTVPKR